MNKKKLLIVGDSYCASKNLNSWCFKLSKKLNCEVKIIGEVSASLFFAYQNLITDAEEYDYYLILVTNPGRLYYKDLPFFSNPYAANWAKASSDINLNKKAEASEMFYNYLSNEVFDNFVHDVIIEKIQKKLQNKNFLIYPNFKTSRIESNYFTMLDITNKCFSKFFNKQEFNFYKDVYQKFQETDKVINHVTLECQEIIAEHFFQILTIGKSNILISNFNNCTPLKLNDYFKERSITS